MKKKTKIILIVLTIIIVLAIATVVTIFALNWQPINKVDLATLEANADVTISYGEASEVPTIIAGDYTDFKVDSGNDAIRALEELQEVFGMTNPKEEYEISNEIEFLDNKTYRMQQYYNGIEVIDRQMVVTADKDGNIKMVSGDYEKITDLDVNPSFDQNRALSIVTETYGDEIEVDTTQLLIKFIDDTPTLCWGVKAVGKFNNLDGGAYNIYINAKTEEIMETELTEDFSVASATGYGTKGELLSFNTNKILLTYEMYDPERKIEIKDYKFGLGGLYISDIITSDDNTWTDTVANQAMSNMAKIYDYYNIKFGIKSYSGKDDKILVIVNDDAKENNASYYQGRGFITLGSGVDGVYDNFVNGLDVLAHEYTHGYIGATDSQIFSDDGFSIGEVNEAYADVIGNIIENYYRENTEVKPFSANENLTFENDELWLMGEDVVLNNEYGMRSMANPSLKNQPNKIGGTYYITLDDTDDYSKVEHNNATVFGHAVYEMWKGGVTTDEIAAILLESCNRLSRSADYNEIAQMIAELADEYCPEKIDVVVDAINGMASSSDDEDSHQVGNNSSNSNLEDIYKQFIMDKEYEKDIQETFGTATYYAIEDINKDGVEELFVQDAGFGGFFNNLIYTYDSSKGEIIFVDYIYSYGMLEYSENDKEIVYAEFKPFSDAGASGFYKLENNKLVWSKTLGHNGPDYKGFFISTEENKQQSIPEAEYNGYFEDADTLDYTKIVEMQLEEVGGISDLIAEARNEHVADGEIQAGSYKLKYGIYKSSLAEYEMLGGIYVLREDGTYTYRNIWKNYDGEAKFVYATGTYEVKYFDNLDVDVAGWGIEFTSTTSDETMANQVWAIKGNNSFEAIQYPNKFTYIE